jgi:hypothetical protein
MSAYYGLVDHKILDTSIVIPDKAPGDPEQYNDELRFKELFKCSESPHYFIHNYVKILDDRKRIYVPFRLYPAQINVLQAVMDHKYIILLKSRQFGASTLIGGAYFLWLMLFRENTTNLVLSKSEREAQVLMVDRFKPMFTNLPSWMKPKYDKDLPNSKTEFAMSNGAKMFSLPTSAGDSYTARACMVDEAALVHNSKTALSDVLLAVQPTIAAGGQLLLVSKPDKSKPDSTFNSIFRSAIRGENDFFPLFVPWQAVPWRDQEWYEKQVSLSIAVDGTKDSVSENYPETWQEALAPKELNKRLSTIHIEQCYDEILEPEPLVPAEVPDILNLMVYFDPVPNTQYIITTDMAEGNPTSDPSCLIVWDWMTGEQVAALAGRYEPAMMGSYTELISEYYNNAPVFPERNNHGHAYILWLQENSDVKVLAGPDSTPRRPKYGYNSSKAMKAMGYAELARMLRKEEVLIHSPETKRQLDSIEGETLRAPKKDHDDHAIASMLFAAARKYVHMEFLLEFV